MNSVCGPKIDYEFIAGLAIHYDNLHFASGSVVGGGVMVLFAFSIRHWQQILNGGIGKLLHQSAGQRYALFMACKQNALKFFCK